MVLPRLAAPRDRFYLARPAIRERLPGLARPLVPLDPVRPVVPLHQTVPEDQVYLARLLAPLAPPGLVRRGDLLVQVYPGKLDRAGFQLNTAGGLNFRRPSR